MNWILFTLFTLIVLLIGIWFFQKFYAKATLSLALVRTGFGGSRILLGGGCICLPIIHQMQRINMGAISITVTRYGRDALLTEDHLRADMKMEFEICVIPSQEGVAAAAKVLGRRVEHNSDQIEEIVSGAMGAAMQNAVARKSLAQLHLERVALAEEIYSVVDACVERFGLKLISASIIRIDQSDLSHLDEQNTFDAKGMRKHAEIISEHRRERIQIETETEIAVRESGLTKHQRQLEIELLERKASITNQETIDRLEAEAHTNTEKVKSGRKLDAERVRMETDQKIKSAEISHDEELRRAEMTAILGLEEAKIENEAHLAKLRTAEFKTKASEEAARAQVLLASEDVQAKKDLAVVKREHETAKARLEKELALNTLQVKNDVDTLATRTKAEVEAKEKQAKAEQVKTEAEAKARAAMIAANNSMDPALIAMRLEERRLDRMPEIMTQMMKPVEKIESIKINQIGGLDSGGTVDSGTGSDSAFGAAMNQILGMAVRLPAMKQMGEEIGLDFDAHLAGRTADYANRLKADRSRDEKK